MDKRTRIFALREVLQKLKDLSLLLKQADEIIDFEVEELLQIDSELSLNKIYNQIYRISQNIEDKGFLRIELISVFDPFLDSLCVTTLDISDVKWSKDCLASTLYDRILIVDKSILKIEMKLQQLSSY